MIIFRLKRVYEPEEPGDGLRILVDRLWPRGLSKEKAALLDGWAKAIAPSPELRKWFNHEIDKWPEFQKRYRAELDRNPEVVRVFLEQIKGHDTVTLLFGAHDPEHNQAVVLKEYLVRAGQ